MITQLKKHSELLINIALIVNYIVLIAVIIMDPSKILHWGGLVISFVGLMLLSFRYMPIPQNPYLGGLPLKERKAVIKAINR
jgi:drug/metabolite transporter (DMT)-like permease